MFSIQRIRGVHFCHGRIAESWCQSVTKSWMFWVVVCIFFTASYIKMTYLNFSNGQWTLLHIVGKKWMKDEDIDLMPIRTQGSYSLKCGIFHAKCTCMEEKLCQDWNTSRFIDFFLSLCRHAKIQNFDCLSISPSIDRSIQSPSPMCSYLMA